MNTKVDEKEIKTNIEVGGAILTHDAINRLKDLQQNDNEDISCNREIIADSICLLTLLLDHYPHKPTQKKAIRNITDLSYIRDYFNDLKKP